MIALYLPGNSIVHRLPASGKLAALAIAGTLLFFVGQWQLLLLALLLSAGLFRLAGVGARRALRELRPMLFMVVLLLVVHAVFNDWSTAWVVALRFCTLVSLAILLTLTTRARDTVQVLVRVLSPFERWGLPVQRLALMLSMTLRYIPVLYRDYQILVEAHQARGGHGRTLPLLMPLLVRSLRQADALAEAIDARAYDPVSARQSERASRHR